MKNIIILAIENILQYMQSKSIWNITCCLTLEAINLLFDLLLKTLDATEKRNVVTRLSHDTESSFSQTLAMPRLRLCQMMNRLTGRCRCLPGASGEDPWSPVYSTTCSSQRAGNIWTDVQFAQGKFSCRARVVFAVGNVTGTPENPC